MSKKILVTGGTGYIGSHTVVELLGAGFSVAIVDNLSNSKKSVLSKIEKIAGRRPEFIRADLLDRAALVQLFAEHEFEAVMHFAGVKAVAESVDQPLKYYENNVVGTVNLLRAMEEAGVKKIVFSSTACVYGNPGVVQYHEGLSTGQNMANPYGETKYVIEEMLKNVAAADAEWEVSILRYFNPIGNHASGLIGEDPNDIPNNLMPVVMKVAKGQIPELNVYGDDYETRDGTCVRDFIHVVDLARGHLAALEHLRAGVGIYNLGTGAGTSVLEIIGAFEKATGQKLAWKFAPRRAGDLPEYYANADKAKVELGWETELTTVDAMRDTWKFLNS
jgi:UDP-glucose 4-epimerase